MAKLHVPTGRVPLEEVVRFLIDDLGVVPQRDDWRAVLEETVGRFRQYRSWS